MTDNSAWYTFMKRQWIKIHFGPIIQPGCRALGKVPYFFFFRKQTFAESLFYFPRLKPQAIMFRRASLKERTDYAPSLNNRDFGGHGVLQNGCSTFHFIKR